MGCTRVAVGHGSALGEDAPHSDRPGAAIRHWSASRGLTRSGSAPRGGRRRLIPGRDERATGKV